MIAFLMWQKIQNIVQQLYGNIHWTTYFRGGPKIAKQLQMGLHTRLVHLLFMEAKLGTGLAKRIKNGVLYWLQWI